MSSASNQDSSVRPSKRLTPRERWALCALGIFALLAFVLWRPVRHYVLTAGVLRSDAPAEAVLTEVVDGAAQPARALEQIWCAGSFSGRSFVVRQLLLRLNSDAALVRELKPLLEEAAFDADLEVRETAFSILAQQKHPALRRWLQAQVNDPDPAVRVIALQQLARIATTNDVSVAIPLLDDPDARVIVAAGGMLKRVTGEDFGLKTAQALPMFAWKPENPPSAVDWSLINRGRDGWRAWWRLHQAEFPAGDGLPRPGPRFYPRPTPDFALEDLDGRRVRLSDFHGQAVLLTFWNLTNQFSVADELVLQTLLQKQSERLAVLAIAVDPAVWPEDCCGDHDGGHGGEPGAGQELQPAHCHPARLDPAKTKSDARSLAARLGVKHPVLLDADAALVAQFGVQDLPAYVLVDAQGNLRRRIAGSRSEAVFRALLEEVSQTGVAPATAGQ